MWLGYYIATSPAVRPEEKGRTLGPAGIITQQTIELRVKRVVGDGLEDHIEITNFTRHAASFKFQIELDSDFADPSEARHGRRQKGKLTKRWRDGELHFRYRADHEYAHQDERGKASIDRQLIVRVRADSPPSYRRSTLTFEVTVGPHAHWRAVMAMQAVIDGKTLPLPSDHQYEEQQRAFTSNASQFEIPAADKTSADVLGSLERAKGDLTGMRLHEFDHRERYWTMAAGLPWYVALFGRDTLTASWQSAILSSDMMVGTLNELARWQGTKISDWRDEQPGKMLHEADVGPIPALNFSPNARYYGSITTSGFYPVVLSALWHWTGNKDLVMPLVAPALRALDWLDRYADYDKDGFYEFQTRSEQGLINQAWKDSDDSMVHEDGERARTPIATCEEQAFVYVAKLHMSELLWWLGDKSDAQRLYGESQELKKRFNEKFWMDDKGFFAMGLDHTKRQMKSVGSDPGHCLAAGIVDESLVEQTVQRLFQNDMFSGWGVRTLSADHPAYNPYSYHRGSVWPVEQGTLTIALVRYGFHHLLHRLCKAQFDAAALFEFHRLPELFAGHPRDEQHPFPGLYPEACSPQAWSASAVFCFLQSMLGLYPYAPLNILLLDPQLPEWLPEITLSNLHVGRAVVTLRFDRERNGKTTFDVLDQKGPLHIVRQPSPWSLTAGYVERVKDLLSSLVA